MSQREAKSDRALRGMAKIARRLDPASTDNWLPPKPPHMHWSTYNRLVDKYNDYNARWARMALRCLGIRVSTPPQRLGASANLRRLRNRNRFQPKMPVPTAFAEKCRFRRLRRIANILRVSGARPASTDNWLPPKPPHMHWSTYNRLVDKYNDYNARWARMALRCLGIRV